MTNRDHEDDIFIVIIAIISILVTTLIDSIQCLIYLNSRSFTPSPTSCATQSNATTPTRTGNTKSQRLSPSTKRRSTTAVQRKVDGGTTQDSQSSPTASSPRGRRSKPSSNTSTSTKSQSSQASATPRRTRTTKSTSPTNTLRSIPNPNHTTADDNRSTNPDSRPDHQSTEPIHLLLGTQEEA